MRHLIIISDSSANEEEEEQQQGEKMIQPIKKLIKEENNGLNQADGTAVVNLDPYLAPYISSFRDRFSSLQLLKKEVRGHFIEK